MLDTHNYLVKKWVKTCILGHLWGVGGQGSGWGQAEVRPEVRQEQGRDATGQEGRCCCGCRADRSGGQIAESRTKRNKEKTGPEKPTLAGMSARTPSQEKNFKAAGEGVGTRSSSLPGAHAKAGDMRGCLVTHLRAEEGTETLLTWHLPRKMLREIKLGQVKGLIVAGFCPLVAQRPPLSSQPHSYPEQHLMALND